MIYRRPVELQRSKGKAYCSTRCYGLFSRKEAPCVICGTLILASRNAKTCSRGCANKHRAGIVYKIGRPHDKVKDNRSIKLRLIDQRGVRCERCTHERVEILQVHHKDRNRNNNEMENLELLCPNCHTEEHYLGNSWLRGMVDKQNGGLCRMVRHQS